jgi:hypothetical protein
MSRSIDWRLDRAEQQVLPEPVPDMTGWTRVEKITWEIERHGLAEMVRCIDANPSPSASTEELDAQDAEDDAILAERAAKAAAAMALRHPADAAAQRTARDTRAAADNATRAAQEARRLAEEAARTG